MWKHKLHCWFIRQQNPDIVILFLVYDQLTLYKFAARDYIVYTHKVVSKMLDSLNYLSKAQVSNYSAHQHLGKWEEFVSYPY